MRDWKLFKLLDEEKEPALAVDAIHNERGYREIRRSLARQYDVGWTEPDIQVVDVDMAGDRHLKLEHAVTNGIMLAQTDAEQGVQHLANRSEERSVGKEWVRTCRSRGSRWHEKKK